jgi:type VI secretion system secreted protein Hcp
MAQVDYFLKVDGIDGESTDEKHKNEIDVSSFNFGASQSGAGAFAGGHGTGKVSMQDFHFVTKVNKASPKLMLSCALGDHIKKAVLTVRKAGGGQQEYYKVTMSDVIISSYQNGGSAGGDSVPTDQVSLNYSKMEIEYKPQGADGKLQSPINVGYDQKLAKKV